jgi:aspartate/methionine/tyrosine aminotransferase
MRGVEIPSFHTSDIAQLAAARAAAGREVIPMHFGEPVLGASKLAIAAAHRALDHEPMQYWNSPRLRERIARHYLDDYGVAVDPARILLTAGASAGLIAVFTALFAHRDRIGLSCPGYPAYRNSLRALDREPVEIDCGPEVDYRMNPAVLAAVPGTLHGLVLASPNNPTGAMLDREQLAAVAAACRARGTRLISDEIYHSIVYGAPAVCALQVDPDVIVVNSFSKLYRMTGWRLGWLVAPPDCVAQLSAHLMNFFLTPPSISQYAALAAFDDLHELRGAVRTYAHNRARLLAELPSLGWGRMAAPDGAFYLYIDVGHLTSDSLNFCKTLLEATGIAAAPGIDFDPVHGGRYIRLSFAIAPQQVERAIEHLRGWLPRFKPGDVA